MMLDLINWGSFLYKRLPHSFALGVVTNWSTGADRLEITFHLSNQQNNYLTSRILGPEYIRDK